MTPAFSVRTTPRFDRLAQRLLKRHPDFQEILARAIHDVEYRAAFGYLEAPQRVSGEAENVEHAGDAEGSRSVEKSNYPADATMRLGFWAPVYGSWIISKHL